MNYIDKNTYLNYSFWNGEYRKGIELNPKGLNFYQIQQAIDAFIREKHRLIECNRDKGVTNDDLNERIQETIKG